MPVLDGVFVPRSPLTPAELHVDFLLHDNHVLERRILVEKSALPKALRLAAVAQLVGDIRAARDDLIAALAAALETTARFGYREAQRELGQLRLADPVTTSSARQPASPGRLSEAAATGMVGVYLFVRETAGQVTDAVVNAVMRTLRSETDETISLLAARKQAGRALHNGVLELVGATLNLGRTVGAAQLDTPPRFALRSEQLDANTCLPCEELHGTIARFASTEYFAAMPPIGCLGGGRCRGIWVMADHPRQVHAPELIAA